MKKLIILFSLLSSLFTVEAIASCTYRLNVFGDTEYSCDNGYNGELKTNVFGEVEDTGSGVTYRKRKNVFGEIEGSNGTTCRRNVFNEVTCE